MNANLITLHSFCLPFSIIKLPNYPSFSHKSQPKPPSFRFLPSSSTFNFKVNVNCSMGNDDSSGMSGYENEELIIEACLTRTLPPALTLEHGIESLKDAVEELKLHPPTCTSGMIRFEVAVPPGAYALDWFCCQPESPRVFPQFYVSKEFENPNNDSAFVSKKYGVFGVGSAVDFNLSSSNSDKWNSFKRYLLVDSLNMTAYGFVGINYDIQSFIVKYETGCTYFVIPQVDLSEYEGFSILSGTLVWNDCLLHNFDQALHSYESSLVQAGDHIPHTPENSNTNLINSSIHKFPMVDHEKVESIYMEATVLGSCDNVEFLMEPKSRSSSSQFCIRFSLETAVSSNVLNTGGTTCSLLQGCPNINSVWASLIVEECSRLGLTYFCIGPGSRSSPLAVAASTHPHVTCISCYDERSLAFHAVGYGRGSRTPAVVITTSGTAVSNLFPAVVEASQDFVPLVLLTADRPQELLATGANQAIDQVNHFGSYVRFFFNLPVPDDDVTSRMVLTTIDSALYWATRSPYGPVHINCPFREPLDNTHISWKNSCLDGLDTWITSTQPFTKYIHLRSSFTHNIAPCLMTDVEKVIQNGRCGLLVIGSINNECDIWAVLHLARHLLWPIVTDILSGLRLRRLLTSYPDYEELVFLDHFDHMLLCDSVRQWVKPDVIIQVGSRITSKRVSSMLEQCYPCSYIVVDRHPCRHDPMHIVTHRIQSTVSQFVGYLLKWTLPRLNSRWSSFLRVVNSMVAWELSFQISSDYSLTEPHVTRALSDVLDSGTALFIGNSMPIRDADMYARGVANSVATSFQLLPYHWLSVVGNRGASGIDGLLSTAVGFAVGCKKRVLCVIGDISFLHDTNGLAIISLSMMWRKPISVIVVNNRGGGIFSFLPIAEKTEPRIMEKYFYYSHDISISKLCAAHSVKHVLAKTKHELQEALLTSQQDDADYVIEAVSSIDSNAIFHSILRKCATQTASHSLATLLRLSVSKLAQDDFYLCKIAKVECLLYEVNLNAPPTSTSVSSGRFTLKRGFILEVTLDDGSTGFGEIAPLEMQKETLQDVEEQLMFLLHALKKATITSFLSLLRESFSSWISSVIGVPPISLFPSVRCGLEMAILNALASKHKCSLLELLGSHPNKGDLIIEHPSSIDICALVDSEKNPTEVANIISTLVEEGFRAIKLKVARRDDPMKDAIVIKEIRRKLGSRIELRVDANRKWTYQQAIKFGSLVKDCALQYIEEPVQSGDDIVKFYEETGIPVALDESIDNIDGNIGDFLARFDHPGIVALVIKPSFVGGFENTEAISHWAHSKGKLAVISSAFESSLSLSSYVQFACYLEMKRAEISHTLDINMEKSIAHGLGTYKWFKEDVTHEPLIIRRQLHNGHLGADINDADRLLRNFQTNPDVIVEKIIDNDISTYQLRVELENSSYLIKVLECGKSREDNNVVLFLHGFMGTSEEWIPIMKTLSRSAKCIAVDLPGHGKSKIKSRSSCIEDKDEKLSIEVVSALLVELIGKITMGKVTLVGYSLGARIALYMALRFGEKIARAIVISGSPGLNDPKERKIRAAKDDSRARSLVSFGLTPFVNSWYRNDMWQSFREHPSFKKNVSNRLRHGDVNGLAKVLSDLSVGRQPPLWEDLKHCNTPLLLIVGEKDEKFKRINRDMYDKINQDIHHEIIEVPNCGHAAHLENPLMVARLVRQFLTKTSK